jgi:hypothetical protein
MLLHEDIFMSHPSSELDQKNKHDKDHEYENNAKSPVHMGDIDGPDFNLGFCRIREVLIRMLLKNGLSLKE